MGERSYPYAVSRIKASESSLIDQNTWTRLWEGSINDCYRLLHEIGYGHTAQNQNDIDEMSNASVTQARELINEITPDPALTDLFLYQVDGHNIKAMLKGLLEREEVDNILLEGGTIPLDTLKEAFEQDTFESFPYCLRQAVEAFEPTDAPDVLSANIDDAVYDQIERVLSNKKTSNELCKKYFKAKIDFTNILSILRAHHLGWNKEQIYPMLIKGGDIDRNGLLQTLELDLAQLPDAMAQGDFSTQIREILTNYSRDKNIVKAESHFNRLSYNIVHEEYMDSFGIGPIINYLLQKEFEARTLRVLFAAKRSGKEIPLADLGVLS